MSETGSTSVPSFLLAFGQSPSVPNGDVLAEAFRAVNALERRLAKAEGRVSAYARDPNGFLLLTKQVTSLHAALQGIAGRLPTSVDPRLESALGTLKSWMQRMVGRLQALREIASDLEPESWQEVIEARKQALGDDLNKGYIPQEGEVGALIEMDYGGLRRAPVNELEFVPGPLSPYGTETGVWELPEDQAPPGLDVFGLPPDAVTPFLSRALGETALAAWQSDHGKPTSKERKRLLAKLRKTIGDPAAFAERVFARGSVTIALADKEVTLLASNLMAQLLRAFGFLQQLERHLEKARIVPVDLRAFSRLPALKKALKTWLLSHLKDADRIHWVE